MVVILEKNLKKNCIMKKQMKSQLVEVNQNMYFPEFALIESSMIGSNNVTGNCQPDASLIFG